MATACIINMIDDGQRKLSHQRPVVVVIVVGSGVVVDVVVFVPVSIANKQKNIVPKYTAL